MKIGIDGMHGEVAQGEPAVRIKGWLDQVRSGPAVEEAVGLILVLLLKGGEFRVTLDMPFTVPVELVRRVVDDAIARWDTSRRLADLPTDGGRSQ